MEKTYGIGQMARSGNCKVQTIRYYEQIGLLPEPNRTQGNQRIYRQEHKDRLNFIRHSRELGFSLDQIHQILLIQDEPDRSCEEVDKITRSHLEDVKLKIRRLRKMQKELERMVTQCACNQVSDCRIIETLSDH